jgi:hypothetical protein
MAPDRSPGRLDRPTLETRFRAERGIGELDGLWAVVKIDRWVRRSGDVARVARKIVDWRSGQTAASIEAGRRTRIALAAEAERLIAAEAAE